MIATDFVLFFLDTFMWYVICNMIYSVGRSFYLGISILTPWRNIFTRLPKRIYSKILATTDMEIKYKPKVLISQVWNAIIISMYREHLLAIDHVQKLLYHQAVSYTHLDEYKRQAYVFSNASSPATPQPPRGGYLQCQQCQPSYNSLITINEQLLSTILTLFFSCSQRLQNHTQFCSPPPLLKAQGSQGSCARPLLFSDTRYLAPASTPAPHIRNLHQIIPTRDPLHHRCYF